MKKIILLLLVVALSVATLSSCNIFKNSQQSKDPDPAPVTKEPTALEKVAEMYRNSAPTKVTAVTTQTVTEDIELVCTYELVNGTVDGAPASVYTEKKQELDTVESGGATEVIKPLVKDTVRVTEAIEGIGSRVNGGNWNAQGSVTNIVRGGMAIYLNEAYLTNVKYENNKLTFVIPVANVATVLGDSYATYIASDVYVTIANDGAVITSIELSYNLKANEAAKLGETAMVVKVEYTYDLEEITI